MSQEIYNPQILRSTLRDPLISDESTRSRGPDIFFGADVSLSSYSLHQQYLQAVSVRLLKCGENESGHGRRRGMRKYIFKLPQKTTTFITNKS